MDHCSYTQLATYLQCPLKYKYHYLDGWEERTDKASMIFGRVFESSGIAIPGGRLSPVLH